VLERYGLQYLWLDENCTNLTVGGLSELLSYQLGLSAYAYNMRIGKIKWDVLTQLEGG